MTADSRKADRNLDATVAAKVMGWICVEARHRGPRSNYFVPSGIAPGNRERTALPDYSTDIERAWEVVVRMEADGWGHKHLVHSPGAENPGCEWWFMQSGRGGKSLSDAHAESVPLAICIAALRAVESAP